ncbi:Palmitoyltransferase zdhhc15 [Allomyces javanicus]|nr:Palmitoyltransferase zdhhc15 [Allomyces javanicus]
MAIAAPPLPPAAPAMTTGPDATTRPPTPPHPPTPPSSRSVAAPHSLAARIEAAFDSIARRVPYVAVAVLIGWPLYAVAYALRPLSIEVVGTAAHTAGTVIAAILAALAMFAYYRVVMTDPGSPPGVQSPGALGRSVSASDVALHDMAASPASSSATTVVPTPMPALAALDDGDAADRVPLVAVDNVVHSWLLTFVRGDGVCWVQRPITIKGNGERRYCRKCQVYKPDRTHHCRTCRKCVLKMDHHCPWINNCVGFYNYKHFLLFVFYTALYALTILICTAPLCLPALEMSTDDEYAAAAHVLSVTLVATLFGLILAGFFAFHASLVLRNMTTIENMEEQRYAVAHAADPNARRVNPFDLGWRANLVQVLGNKVALWWVPVTSPVGDGLSFPINHKMFAA